jgi:hypothetical protein
VLSVVNKLFMLIVVMLNVFMFCVFMLSVVASSRTVYSAVLYLSIIRELAGNSGSGTIFTTLHFLWYLPMGSFKL